MCTCVSLLIIIAMRWALTFVNLIDQHNLNWIDQQNLNLMDQQNSYLMDQQNLWIKMFGSMVDDEFPKCICPWSELFKGKPHILCQHK